MAGETAAELEGFGYLEAEFGDDGRPISTPGAPDIARSHGATAPTDVIVMVHGWNNTHLSARALYQDLARSLRAVYGGQHADALRGRTLTLLGVLWPSCQWDWFERMAGTIGALDAAPATELQIRLDALRGLFPAREDRERLERARTLVPDVERSQDARLSFVRLVVGLLNRGAEDAEDASDQLFSLPPRTLVERFSPPPALAGDSPRPALAGDSPRPALAGDSPRPALAGDAALAGELEWNPLGGLLDGLRNLVDFAAYYRMKERAGTVGRNGLAPFLRTGIPQGARIHLVGHSFGARLVTAAAATGGLGHRCSVSLLQGAFSHHGFAHGYLPGHDGFFRKVVTSGVLSGPMVITHTRNDKLVSLAYALASRLAGQDGANVAAEIGGADSLYGAIGANGAQVTPEAVQGLLLPVGQPYALTAGRPHNLKADAFVSGHCDVTGPEVAHAILSAVAATP
ncbi:hypothetical protein AB0395_27070 [Streptosporangium sp. NPDC051023]|uniref:hypothetical protein n=1 Tax=Streptosporangium sp. NPDC051023 TaxID=3155410 RepID=UPI00344C4FA4